jgi:hypothetical protein
MMRKAFLVALVAALAGLAGIAKEASATITITLEWGACGGGAGGCTATGTDTITVAPGGGQTLRLDVYLSHDLTQGIAAEAFSLNFDTNGENEFNLNAGTMVAIDWTGSDIHPGAASDVYGPIASGVTSHESAPGAPGATGRVNSFDSGFGTSLFLPLTGATYSVGTFTGTAPARYRLGQAFFTVNSAVTDGADFFAGLFAAADEFVDGLNTTLGPSAPPGTFVFGTATVNVIPEPGTVSLLGLGLVGLVLAGRGRRRS